MPALQYFLDKGGQFRSAFGAVLHKLCFILLHQLLCLGGEHGFSLLLKVSGRLKFELPPKSWTSPPTHKVQFFYEQIYITLQIPSRTPLPAYTQPTAYRRALRHFPNPPETMDTRLSRRRYRRTRTSPIQNHAPTPQKPLHRR